MIDKKQEIFTPLYLQLHDIWDEHERAHWHPAEADMRTDIDQWKIKITAEEKLFIKMILRMFTQSDTNVCGSYVDRLLPIFKHPDARIMLLSFASRETTHMIGYKKLNDALGYDTEAFAREFLDFDAMRTKHEFMIEERSVKTHTEIGQYLAKQVLMEGINLFGSFAMLLSFSKLGKLPGMVSVNKWSIVDESLHVRGLIALFQIYLGEHPRIVNDQFKAQIYETYTRCIAIEDASIDLAYSTKGGPESPELIKQYVRYVGDYRMQQLGFKPQYGITENPLPWLDEITGNTFGNFFETTVTEYSKNPLTGDWEYQ